jgi:ABC-type multidrug transport system ATPase subunit
VAAGLGADPEERKSMSENDSAVMVSGVTFDYRGTHILEGLSFDCSQGEWVLLAGPSGAGKSTLLRIINGLQLPTRGRVLTLGSPIPGRGRRQARAVWRQTGTVLQEVALFETKSARANVQLALTAIGVDRATARRQAMIWLERLGMGDKVEAYPWRLSGGERQRVALARALAPGPSLLLLDEPTSALDTATAAEVLEAIGDLCDAGTTVIMSSHREDEVVARCDKRIGLSKGRMVGETLRLEIPGKERASVVRDESRLIHPRDA